VLSWCKGKTKWKHGICGIQLILYYKTLNIAEVKQTLLRVKNCFLCQSNVFSWWHKEDKWRTEFCRFNGSLLLGDKIVAYQNGRPYMVKAACVNFHECCVKRSLLKFWADHIQKTPYPWEPVHLQGITSSWVYRMACISLDSDLSLDWSCNWVVLQPCAFLGFTIYQWESINLSIMVEPLTLVHII